MRAHLCHNPTRRSPGHSRRSWQRVRRAGPPRASHLTTPQSRSLFFSQRSETSDFTFEISDFTFEISDFTFEISDFTFEISGLTFEISGLTFEISGLTFEISDF